MSQVRAKFKCDVVRRDDVSKGKSVSFSPVIDGSEENQSFSKYTPSGQIHMFISDETPASEVFEEGKEYYVDFTKAE